MGSGSLPDSLRETLAVFDGPGTPRTTPEIAEALSLGRRSTYARLERLAERDEIKTKKVGANARVWWRPPAEDRTNSTNGKRERDGRNEVPRRSVVATLGQRALECTELDPLLRETVDLTAKALGTEYCEIFGFDGETDALRLKASSGEDAERLGETVDPSVEGGDLSAYTVMSDEPVVVENAAADERFNTAMLRNGRDIERSLCLRIGSAEDPWGILILSRTAQRSFSEREIESVQAVRDVLEAAIKRYGYERTLRHRHDELTSLDDLNAVVSDIITTIIEQSTRADIEQAVCDALASTEMYQFVWLSEVDLRTDTFEPLAAAGTDGYEEDITLSLDPNDPRSDGPAATAIREQETQVVQDVFSDPAFEPWRDAAAEYGFRSMASIPVAHDETVYGVLGVYAGRTNAFGTVERELLSQLGQIVGHAIAAAERKQALMSDKLVELEFEIQDVFSNVDASIDTAGPITFEHIVAVSDRTYVVYGTAPPNSIPILEEFLEELSHWKRFTVRQRGGPIQFELKLTDPPAMSSITALGGYVDAATVKHGNFHMKVHLSPTIDVRRAIEVIEQYYPQVELLRRQQITRTRDDPQHIQRQVIKELTERQRTVLDVAYYAGFFEWPRKMDGAEIADSLGVSPPTFHQHLRTAEKKVFDSLYNTRE